MVLLFRKGVTYCAVSTAIAKPLRIAMGPAMHGVLVDLLAYVHSNFKARSPSSQLAEYRMRLVESKTI